MDGPIPWSTLYATTITSAKPREREYKLTDGAGLYLLVKPKGRKLRRLNYAHLGEQRPLSFGAWPEVGLANARERRDEARRMDCGRARPIARSLARSRSREAVRGERLQAGRRGMRRQEPTREYGGGHARQNTLAARQGLSEDRQPADHEDHRIASARGAPRRRGHRRL